MGGESPRVPTRGSIAVGAKAEAEAAKQATTRPVQKHGVRVDPDNNHPLSTKTRLQMSSLARIIFFV